MDADRARDWLRLLSQSAGAVRSDMLLQGLYAHVPGPAANRRRGATGTAQGMTRARPTDNADG